MCDSHPHQHEHVHHDHSGSGKSRPEDFRAVVTGKGGVGKTTLTALLARQLARRSYRVLALDADPQMNLPYALGMPVEKIRQLVPLSKNTEYVEEKTGVRPGSGWGLFFRLNPDVDDVVDRFGMVAPDQVRLLVMGNTVQPAAGCLCPENSLLAAVVNAISLRRDEAILMDTQAGFEHFGRALARGFRHAVIVSDPTFNGLQVALHAAFLARQLDIAAIHLVVNRVSDDTQYHRAMKRIDDEGGFPFTTRHSIPFDDTVSRAEPSVSPVFSQSGSRFHAALDGLVAAMTSSHRESLQCAS